MNELQRKCKHKVMVNGGGCMGDALTCEACGFSIYPEDLSAWIKAKIFLRQTKVRELASGEMFFEDGVRKPGLFEVYRKPIPISVSEMWAYEEKDSE